jgi:polygalacturonase
MAPSDIAPAGLVGDGVINNNAALQAAFTAAASGGTIIIPCGVYKITGQMTVTVASGKHFTLAGGGQNCAKIAVSGTVWRHDNNPGGRDRWRVPAGFYNHHRSGRNAKRDHYCQDHGECLERLCRADLIAKCLGVRIGLSQRRQPTKYWAHGFTLNNVNNVSLDNVFGIGGGCVSNLCNGDGLNLVGKGSGSYGVVFNIVNSNFGLSKIGIAYGDWIQGVAVDKTNVTGCQIGIGLVQTPAGVLDQLIVRNSQFNNFVTNIYADTGASGAIKDRPTADRRQGAG